MKQKIKIILITVQVFTACICVLYFQILPFRDNFVASTIPKAYFAIDAATFDSRSMNTDVSFYDLYKKFNCSEPGNPDYFINNWINVTSSGNDSIYAAFKDENIIRITAVTLTFDNSRPSRFCKVWSKTNEGNIAVTTVLAKLRINPEHHGTKYSAAFYICPLPGETMPVAVAVSDRNETTPCKQPILPVIHAKPSTQYDTTYRVCVKPLYGNLPSAFEVIEWIELNRILGVTGFTVYVHSTAKQTEHVLHYYQRKGVVEILPWTLPLGPVHCWGQLAAINDCLYRHRNRTKYLAFFDMDEFIIPKQKEDYTWSDMMKRFPRASAYSFRNTFFRRETTQHSAYYEMEKIPKRLGLVTLTNLRRDDLIYREAQRSKLIVNPENIDTVGIHHIHEFKHKIGDYPNTYYVKPDDGLMHHYRVMNYRKYGIIDDGVLKYETELIKRVHFVLNEIDYL